MKHGLHVDLTEVFMPDIPADTTLRFFGTRPGTCTVHWFVEAQSLFHVAFGLFSPISLRDTEIWSGGDRLLTAYARVDGVTTQPTAPLPPPQIYGKWNGIKKSDMWPVRK